MFREIDIKKFKAEGVGEELTSLLKHLEDRDLSEATIQFINVRIEELNRFPGPDSKMIKKLTTLKMEILKHLQTNYNLVPPKYYTNLWMPLGMSVFGLPLGMVLFGTTENSSFIAIGLPIGLAVGSLYGANLDKKAESEGRVLKFAEQK